MGITNSKGETRYNGAVIGEEEHMWADGMLEVWTVVWNMETHSTERISTGYYGSDGCNLCENMEVVFGLSTEVSRDILRTLKKEAVKAFCNSVVEKKEAIEKGIKAKVVKGKKVPVGTELDIFWVGEKETYRSRQYSWMHETERIAGGHDADGNVVWVKAEYLKNITPLKSPKAAERKKFIKAYVVRNAPCEAIANAVG